MDLELSTSPRATWVWAPDVDQATALRGLLLNAGCDVSDARGGNAETRTFDINIGVDALDALEALRNAGYTFRWHTTQHALNRNPDCYGIPVSAAK
jgi:hypothetical protein